MTVVTQNRRFIYKSFLIALYVLLFHPLSIGAHSSLEDTYPKGNSILEEEISTIEAWFQDPVEIHSESVIIKGNGKEVIPEEIYLDKKNKGHVIAELENSLPAGKYSVDLNAVALDGYVIKEQFQFEVKVASKQEKKAKEEDIAYGDLKLMKASPEDGDIKDSPVNKIDFWFNQPVEVVGIGVFNDKRIPITTEWKIDEEDPTHVIASFNKQLAPGSHQISWFVKPKDGERDDERMGVYYFAVDNFTPITARKGEPITNFTTINLKQISYWIIFLSGSILFGVIWFSNYISRLKVPTSRFTFIRWFFALTFIIGIFLYLSVITQELPKLKMSEMIGFKIIWIPIAQIALVLLGMTFKKIRVYLVGISVVLFSFYSGHSSYPKYGGLLATGINSLHLLSISIWLGGLLSLFTLGSKENKSEWIRTNGKAFSKWGLSCTIIILLTGLWMTFNFVPKFSWDSFSGSIWGKTVLIKTVFFTLMIFLAYLNRRSIKHSINKITKLTVTQIRTEFILGIIVIFFAGVLVVSTPSAAEQGIYPEQMEKKGLNLAVDIEPMEMGYNEFTLTFDSAENIKFVDIKLSMPPDWTKTNRAFRVKENIYKLTGANLHAAGTVFMEAQVTKQGGEKVILPFKIVVPGEVRFNE